MVKTWCGAKLKSADIQPLQFSKKGETDMHASTFKPAAAAGMALAAVLALGACNKKTDDTTTVPGPASTGGTGYGTTPRNSGTAGTSTTAPAVMPPASAASGGS